MAACLVPERDSIDDRAGDRQGYASNRITRTASPGSRAAITNMRMMCQHDHLHLRAEPNSACKVALVRASSKVCRMSSAMNGRGDAVFA